MEVSFFYVIDTLATQNIAKATRKHRDDSQRSGEATEESSEGGCSTWKVRVVGLVPGMAKSAAISTLARVQPC